MSSRPRRFAEILSAVGVGAHSYWRSSCDRCHRNRSEPGLAAAQDVIAPEQRDRQQEICDDTRFTQSSAPTDGQITVGSSLANAIELHAIDVPDVKYRYVVVDGQTVMVEPEMRNIIQWEERYPPQRLDRLRPSGRQFHDGCKVYLKLTLTCRTRSYCPTAQDVPGKRGVAEMRRRTQRQQARGNSVLRRPEKDKEQTGWWARRDSNPQPSGYEPPALTIELQAPRRAG